MLRACLLLLLLPAAPGALELTILHNNDLHGRFEETTAKSATCGRGQRDCVGGFARVAHEVRRHRAAASAGGPAVLYLNAGDTYTGTAWFSIHKWRICADFLNALQPDAVCLGNHEFDNGVAGLAPFVEAAQFPIIASNLNLTLEPTLAAVRRSVVLDVNGTQVGVVGYLTPDTRQISSPGAVAFGDEVVAVRAASEELAARGVNIIIALGHSGHLVDQRVAREAPLVDVVVGGHTNTFLWNGPAPAAELPEGPYPRVVVQPGGRRVPVVQAYAYSKYLGRLNVTFDAAGELVRFGGQPLLLDATVPQAPDMLRLLERFRPEIDKLNTRIVGRSRVLLDGDGCRRAECNFGNLIADALVYYVASVTAGPFWTRYPIGLVNGGSIRGSIDAPRAGGNVSYGELLAAQPFGNEVVALEVRGADLVRTLELAARGDGETSYGEFLQVSGLHVVYDRRRPSGARVVSVAVRCGRCDVPAYEPLRADAVYSVVTTGFLAGGGDGHYVLKNSTTNRRVQDLNDLDTIVWYFGKQSPVYPEVQGRIRVVDGGEGAAAPSAGAAGGPAQGLALAAVAALVICSKRRSIEHFIQ